MSKKWQVPCHNCHTIVDPRAGTPGPDIRSGEGWLKFSCAECGATNFSMLPEPEKTAEKGVALTLKLSSWANLFHVLNEEGLGGPPGASRQRAYFNEFGEYFSEGGFWAAVQFLQQQLENETGLSTQREYVNASFGRVEA